MQRVSLGGWTCVGAAPIGMLSWGRSRIASLPIRWSIADWAAQPFSRKAAHPSSFDLSAATRLRWISRSSNWFFDLVCCAVPYSPEDPVK